MLNNFSEDFKKEKEKKDRIEAIKLKKEALSKLPQDTKVIKLYKIDTQCKIFNELKLRKGPKSRITFSNSRGYPVEITGADIVDNKVVLRCIFCKTRYKFSMWLDTFLADGTKVKPDKFQENYLVTVAERIKQYDEELKTLENEVK